MMIDLCGHERDMLCGFRGIQVECSSYLGLRSNHVILECCSCILSQRRCRLPRRSHFLYILTIDWKNIVVGFDIIRYSQGYTTRCVVRDHLVYSNHDITSIWLHHRLGRINLLQNRP